MNDAHRHTTDTTENAPMGTGRFSLSDVVSSFLVGLLLPTGLLVAWMFASHAMGGSLSVMFAAIPVWAATAVTLLYLLLKRRRGFSAADLGFTAPTRSWWHLVWVAPAAITSSAVTAALVGTALGLTRSGGSDSGSLAGLGVNAPVAAAVALTACVAAPLLEETIFRGVLLGYLRQKWSPAPAVATCAVIFGLCHVAPEIMVYVIPLGVWLAGIRLWFKSMWPNVLVHALNNTLVTAIALTAVN